MWEAGSSGSLLGTGWPEALVGIRLELHWLMLVFVLLDEFLECRGALVQL